VRRRVTLIAKPLRGRAFQSMLCVFWRYLSGLSTMKRAVTLIAAISLTLAGVILSYVEVEATHHVPTKLVLLALLMLGAGIVWLVVEISRTPNDR
jgi:hypothetical protein